MKMNKKGFTLIELLAVIVILAVIALIAVPQVLKILNQARQSAAEDSAYGVLTAAESYTATYMLEHQGDWAGTLTFTCNGTKCTSGEGSSAIDLDIKGTIPKSGTIVLDNNGVASIGTSLQINNYYCSQNGDKVTCSTTNASA